MTTEERAAYLAGVQVMIDIASRGADAMRPRAIEQPIRYERALETLDAIVEAGQNIIAPADGGSSK